MSNNSKSSKPAPAGLFQSSRLLPPPTISTPSTRIQELISVNKPKVEVGPIPQVTPPQAGAPSKGPNTTLLNKQEKKALSQQIEALLKDVNTGKVETREDLSTALDSLVKVKVPAEAKDKDRDRWLQARRLFIEKYREARPDYENFTEIVRNECERILTTQPEVILHQKPSSRTKKVDSLQKKIKKEIPRLRSNRSHTNPMEQLYKKVVDIAGIRILVYFPDDVSRVVKAIENSTTLEIDRSGVSYSRNRTDHRAVDKSDQSTDRVGLIYTYGAFQEEVKSLSTDEIVRRWKHSGYHAVHLHVKMPAAEAPEFDGADPEPELYDEDEPEELNTSVHNDGLSDSAQTPMRDTKGKGPELESSTTQNAPLEDFEFPEHSLKVAEIQISTVVMHAWSQVEHDLIYKNPHRITVNDTMARMLDAVNGSSINSEIMLEELQRTIYQAQREAEENDRLPFSPESLARFLQKEYLDDSDGLTWEAHPLWVSVLSTVACSPSERGSPGRHIGTPAKLREFITRHRIFASESEEKADLAVAILKAVGTELRNMCLDDSRLIVDTLRKPELDPARRFLYKCMVTANAFSIMVAIDGLAATSWFTQKFCDRIDQLRMVNSVVLERPETRRLVDLNLTNDPLVEFVDDFCNASFYETHNIAVALASLYFHIELPNCEVKRLNRRPIQKYGRDVSDYSSIFQLRPRLLQFEQFHFNLEFDEYDNSFRPVIFLDVLGHFFATSRGFVDDSSWSRSKGAEQEEHPLHGPVIFGDFAPTMDAWKNNFQIQVLRTEDNGSAEIQSSVPVRMQLKSSNLHEVRSLMLKLQSPFDLLDLDEDDLNNMPPGMP